MRLVTCRTCDSQPRARGSGERLRLHRADPGGAEPGAASRALGPRVCVHGDRQVSLTPTAPAPLPPVPPTPEQRTSHASKARRDIHVSVANMARATVTPAPSLSLSSSPCHLWVVLAGP